MKLYWKITPCGYYLRAATNRERLLIFSLVAEGGYYSRAATNRGAASNRANTVPETEVNTIRVVKIVMNYLLLTVTSFN